MCAYESVQNYVLVEGLNTDGQCVENFETMLGNFLAVTCSPNILLIEENAVSANHLYP